MKVCIIGWYGTETLGDRAILAGILSILSKLDSKTEVKLGSLYPFFSKRTISEDFEFYKHVSGAQDFQFEIFESKKSSELNKAISESDLLIMGGGPLMHINDLFMVDYAFSYAKKKKVPSVLFGCGVGPMFKTRHKGALQRIVKRASLPILRDEVSKDYLKSLGTTDSVLNRIEVLPDPSLQAIQDFQKSDRTKEKGDYVAVNMREFPAEYSQQGQADLQVKLSSLLSDIAKDQKVQLIPMHYFHIGGDDRKFLNALKFDLELENIEVQNEPLSLYQTFLKFEQAQACVGMRFHSVVFQTALNGKNLVLDYTEPGKGKITGFLRDWNLEEAYKNRYVNLQTWNSERLDLKNIEQIQLPADDLSQRLAKYEDFLKSVL